MARALTIQETTGELTDEVSAIARRLLSEVGEMQPASRQRRLLERALAVAAEAQQSLADHKARIAELEAMSVSDDLTGLANRRGLTLALDKVLAKLARGGSKAALILMDLDGFKTINDTFGHAAGDRALRVMAELLRGHVRGSDTVARPGGDEFAVLLPEATLDLARYRASALSRLIDRSVVRWGAARIPLSASVGLTPIERSDTLESALARADMALYRIKRARKPA